jgi:hypothetical protein
MSHVACCSFRLQYDLRPETCGLRLVTCDLMKESFMSIQTFTVGQVPRVRLGQCQRDLVIATWDERTIEVESDDLSAVRQDGDALVIDHVGDDLHLRVPADTAVSADQVHGDAHISGVRAAELRDVGGDCELASIDGEARVDRVGGDLEARGVGVLTLGEIGGDCTIDAVQTASLGSVGGDLAAKEIREALRYANIGGDMVFQGGSQTALHGGGIGGDLTLSEAGSVHIGEVGGDAALKSVGGDLHMGSVGGDAAIKDVRGDLRLGSVGGDAAIHAHGATLNIGSIGGDLGLDTVFQPGSVTRINVGGDAEINLPGQLDLTIRATVGGEVSGARMTSTGGGVFTAVYGEGSARIDLVIGGDLELHTGDTPRTSSSSWGWDEQGEFQREMQRLGEEMGRLGEELGREFSEMFGGKAHRHAERERHRAEERLRDAAERMREAERRARHAEEHHQHRNEAGRVHVRINDREWRFDADRLERLKQQAREAARAGISGAIEAVERALAGIGAPPPPPPGAPNRPPPPGVPNMPPPPPPPATGQTIRIDVEPPAANAAPTAPNQPAQPAPVMPRDTEAERAAILQMVAAGRISPEEGDMLLDALG